MNMTAGMTVDAIPKAIRKFRVPPEPTPLQPSAMTSAIPSWNTTFLQSLLGTENVDDQTQSVQESLKKGILVNWVNGGVRRELGEELGARVVEC